MTKKEKTDHGQRILVGWRRHRRRRHKLKEEIFWLPGVRNGPATDYLYLVHKLASCCCCCRCASSLGLNISSPMASLLSSSSWRLVSYYDSRFVSLPCLLFFVLVSLLVKMPLFVVWNKPDERPANRPKPIVVANARWSNPTVFARRSYFDGVTVDVSVGPKHTPI